MFLDPFVSTGSMQRSLRAQHSTVRSIPLLLKISLVVIDRAVSACLTWAAGRMAEAGLQFRSPEGGRQISGSPSTSHRQSEPLDLPPLGPMRDPAVKPVPLVCTRPPTARTVEMRSLFGQPSRDAAPGGLVPCSARNMARLSLTVSEKKPRCGPPLPCLFPFTVCLDPRVTTAAETPARLPLGVFTTDVAWHSDQVVTMRLRGA
jgi:hypothetical protein